MKKLSLICIMSFVFCIWWTFAYTSTDISNASYLSDQGIVTKQTSPTGYRLDDTILRQEVIGMALKIKGVTLPEDYKCKKYFADATNNNWVCRAVELAADNGIITRSNTYANPTKLVTKSEALAMIMNAAGIQYATNITYTWYKASTPKWQIDVVEWAVANWILKTAINFWVDKNSLRKEVFEFAKKTKISNFDKTYSNGVISFRYPSEYYDIFNKKISNTTIKLNKNEILIWANNKDYGWEDFGINIKYYKNIYSDSDILNAIWFTDNEWCNDPVIKDKKQLSSWAYSFRPDYLKKEDMCWINYIWYWFHFPKDWILVTVDLGQEWLIAQFLSTSQKFTMDDVTYRQDFYNYSKERIQKFLETFRVVQ